MENEEEIEEPEEEKKAPPDLAGYGRRAYDIGRRFGKGLGKGAKKAGGKAAGTAAGAAAGTAVGGPLGTLIGAATSAIASKLVEKFGPKAIKWGFYIFLSFAIIIIGLAVFIIFGFLGLGRETGKLPFESASAELQCLSAAAGGSEASLRKCLTERAKKTLEELEMAKAQTKDEEVLKLIEKAENLCREIQTSSDPQTKENKIKEAISLLRQIAVKFPVVAAYQGEPSNVEELKKYKPADITKLVVNKRGKRLYFYAKKDGQEVVVAHAPINIGKGKPGFDPYGEGRTPESYVTPKGRYFTKEAKFCRGGCISDEFGTNMGPVIIKIWGPPGDPINNRGILFHGRDPNKEGRKLIPTAGCIRLYNRDLEVAYPYMENKTVEII